MLVLSCSGSAFSTLETCAGVPRIAIDAPHNFELNEEPGKMIVTAIVASKYE
jgi:hypothetical protein